MKKIFMMAFMLLVAFTLIACTENNTELPLDQFPTFEEDLEIQMSPEQMVVLLENISYEDVMTDVVRMYVTGTLEMRQTSTYEDWYWDDTLQDFANYTVSETNEVNLDIDLELFALFSEMVEEARLFFTGTIDMDAFNSSNWNNELDEQTIDAAGTVEAYLYEQAFYLNPNMTVIEDGVTTTYDSKQKLNQLLTQEMYDEMLEDIEMQLGELLEQDPQTIDDQIDTDKLDEVMQTLPNLKVYQNGVVTTIVFEITKQDIIDNAIDFMLAATDAVGEELPTQEEIDEARIEIETMINDAVDALTFKYSISIVGQLIQSVAIEVTALIDNEDVYLDIDMLFIIEFGVTLPEFPEDLDTYETVENFDMFE